MLARHAGVSGAERTLEVAPEVLDTLDTSAVLAGVLTGLVVDLHVAIAGLVDSER